ncbi:MAG: ABC transporter permease [Gammaproteobacteria bacterium]|jgi:NitT/TauT family transport system permease protein|nr:ABC transporter permease [Gammaproteobacteria bacterium]
MKRLINQQPSKVLSAWLGVLPFVIVAVLYLVASDLRLAENPDDKLLPSPQTIGDSIARMALEPSKRTGDLLLWGDTLSSLIRLGLGIGISALVGLVFGIATGAIPYVRANLSPLITAISMIPPMAILPILFIVFGLGELSKVVLIVIGITPFLIRDMQLRVRELPAEQIIKAQTLSASTWQVIIRVILPQILPRLINAVRLSLGPAWLFLIAAEAIAATDGLGYRIFLVRRYLAMDVILPYVVWITVLAFLMDVLLRVVSAKLFPWYGRAEGTKT